MKNVIFMGTPDYAKAILEELIADSAINVVAVFTQPDKPVGRKKILTPPPVKVLALEHGIKIFQPNSLKKEDYATVISDLNPDFIVVAAFGQILPKSILDIAPCINLHASILPAYRGASPIQQSLLNDDSQTGVTAMLMDVGMDTGDIISIETLNIPHTMLANELFDALTKIAAKMTPNILHNFESFTIVKQDDTLATQCKKISKADGEVSFINAKELYNKYRAFTPWPGVYLASGLKLLEMALLETTSSNESGKILNIEKDYIEVGCSLGSIRITMVQPPSKKAMPIVSYINGQRLDRGDYLA